MSGLHDAPVCIAFEGAISIRNIDAVRSGVLQALSLHTTVNIDCSAIESADLSAVQLLLAARRSAQTNGKQLQLHPPPAPALHGALLRGGLVQPGADGDPFWSGG